jgi:hypothetical protein
MFDTLLFLSEKVLTFQESFDVKYEVHARNLSSPLKGTLKINLAHTVENG